MAEPNVPPVEPLSDEVAQWFVNLSSDAQRIFEEVSALTKRLPLDTDGLLRVVECQEQCVARLRELAMWDGSPELTGAVSGMFDVFKAIWENMELLFGTQTGLLQGVLRVPDADNWRKRCFGHPQARVFILPDRLAVQVPPHPRNRPILPFRRPT
jgi:hypothetical protein